MRKLNENGIELDTLCEVEDRELYKFITEELFFHEIDDIRIPGMVNHFIYEDFHPNHEYDIKRDCEDFFTCFLKKQKKFYSVHLSRKTEKNNKLDDFLDSFQSFDLKKFEILDVRLKKRTAQSIFYTDFTGTIETSAEKIHFRGEGMFKLVYQNDYWFIDSVRLPGKELT